MTRFLRLNNPLLFSLNVSQHAILFLHAFCEIRFNLLSGIESVLTPWLSEWKLGTRVFGSTWSNDAVTWEDNSEASFAKDENKEKMKACVQSLLSVVVLCLGESICLGEHSRLGESICLIGRKLLNYTLSQIVSILWWSSYIASLTQQVCNWDDQNMVEVANPNVFTV